MAETLEQRQDAMRKVIQHILEQKPFGELTFEEKRIAKECVDKKYIEGVELVEMISGRVVMECRYKPFLTEAGVAFLSGHNSFQQSDDSDPDTCQDGALKEEPKDKEAKKFYQSSGFWGIVLSIIGIILTIYFGLRSMQ